jgi:hypothetical protein
MTSKTVSVSRSTIYDSSDSESSIKSSKTFSDIDNSDTESTNIKNSSKTKKNNLSDDDNLIKKAKGKQDKIKINKSKKSIKPGEKNIDALVSFIKEKIGEDNIKKSIEQPDCLDEIKIYKQAIEKYFILKNRIKNYSAEVWKDKDYISVKDFIKFLEKKDEGKRGNFHEHLPFLHKYYNIQIERGIPDYLSVPKNITIFRDMRLEHIGVWFVMNMIYEDELFQKFMNIFEPSYQIEPKEGDNRYYEIVFKKLKIILEIQENNKSHDENFNDYTKEELGLMRGFRVVYLKTIEFNDPQYFIDFWYGNAQKYLTGFRQILLNALLAYNDDNKIVSNIRKEFVLHTFLNNMKEELKNIEAEIIDYEQEYTDDEFPERYHIAIKEKDYLSNNIDNFSDSANKYLSVFNRWYKKSKNIEQYVINPFNKDFNLVFDNIIGDEEKENNFFELCLNKKHCGQINKDYKTFNVKEYKELNDNYDNVRFSWKGIVKIFLDFFDKENKKIIQLISPDDVNYYTKYILNLLLSVEKTYSVITDNISEHLNTIINFQSKCQDKIEQHINKLKDKKYEKDIISVKNNNDKLEQHIYNFEKAANNFLKKCGTIIQKSKKQNNIDITNLFEDVIKAHSEMYPNSKLVNTLKDGYKFRKDKDRKTYTLNTDEVNKSIIKELSELPIIYTGKIFDKVDTLTVERLFLEYNIPKGIENTIIKELSILYNNSGNNNYCLRIKVVK